MSWTIVDRWAETFEHVRTVDVAGALGAVGGGVAALFRYGAVVLFGTPPDLLHAIGCGVDMFDCVIPTHLAWQGTAFTSTSSVSRSAPVITSALP